LKLLVCHGHTASNLRTNGAPVATPDRKEIPYALDLIIDDLTLIP
jgi:hypothetical protein